MKMNQEKAQLVISEYLSGITRKDLAVKYGICNDYVDKIITGKCYPQCGRPKDISRFSQRKNNEHKLDILVAQEIIDLYLQGLTSSTLASKYGVSVGAINAIIIGKNYKSCTRPLNIEDIIHKRHYTDIKKWITRRNESLPPLSDFQLEIIVGSLLGDGSIKKKYHHNCRFSKPQCVKFKEYLDWHFIKLYPYSTKLYKGYTDRIIINSNKKIINYKTGDKKLKYYCLGTIAHPVFTKLREKWYPNGVKVVPCDLKLTPLTIAIWYCDDGSNDFSSRKASISTQGFSFNDVELLAGNLHNFDLFPKIESRLSPYTKRPQPILKFYSSSYKNLINLVTSHVMWDCFKYKVKL
jgi:hypothetical protein